jgi:hypothetical protein
VISIFTPPSKWREFPHCIFGIFRSRHYQPAMSKSKSKRKKQGIHDGGLTKKVKQAAIISPPPEEEPTTGPQTLHAIVPAEDYEIAIDTLNTLAEHPKLIKSKACKDLRTAVYEFRQACTTGFNASGTALHSHSIKQD